jgi:MFS family permease
MAIMDNTPLTPRSPAAARVGVAAIFTAFGTTMATWAIHLPALQQATGISKAMLGTLLLICGVGGLVGMQLGGALVDRFNYVGATGVGAMAAMALAVVLPLSASTLLMAAVGAATFGLAAGIADVSMNAAAVEVERAYRRPIMASFHALFSIGNVMGALLSAAGFALQASATATASVVAALCVCAATCAGVVLLRSPVHTAPPQPAPVTEPRPRNGRRILVLGSLAFLLFFIEGSALDWSALHAQQHLGASSSAGAVAFGSLVLATTIGRLTVDRLAVRIGRVRIVRTGAVLAVAGFVVIMASSSLILTVMGWALVGLGIAGGIPQVFSAAGNLGPAAGKSMARVVGMGYLALLSGPAIIGWSAEVSSINAALIWPMCAAFVCVCAASAVGDAQARPNAGAEPGRSLPNDAGSTATKGKR